MKATHKAENPVEAIKEKQDTHGACSVLREELPQRLPNKSKYDFLTVDIINTLLSFVLFSYTFCKDIF